MTEIPASPWTVEIWVKSLKRWQFAGTIEPFEAVLESVLWLAELHGVARANRTAAETEVRGMIAYKGRGFCYWTGR